MKVVVALGGNALLQRGEPMTENAQRTNIKKAVSSLAEIAINHQLLVTHGNGPQVGLLALQGNAYDPEQLYPLDVLGAETEGMIGYMLEQELGNVLPEQRPLASILTMIEVDPDDPAFTKPTKFIGPIYTESQAKVLAKKHNWSVKPDGDNWRRVVASPLPKRVIEIRPIKWLLEKNTVVICGGGGGIPTSFSKDGLLHGVEAVIDKDFASELIAREVSAEMFIMVTDVDGVYINWGTSGQRLVSKAHPDSLLQYDFAAGSIGPKVKAACDYAHSSGNIATIGALKDMNQIVSGNAGTHISTAFQGIEFYR